MGPQGIFQCRLLSCYDSWQLADLTVSLIPRIWAKQSKYTLSKYAIANTNLFRQFCYKLFKDTQISSGCVLLALYYLDQLKSIYPTLPNSELRLFTIALILANKYLDDNTFTNKTWSEVSGIPLRELNWMEMEYLDALDYSLHVHCFRFCSWVRQCECWISTPLVKRSSGCQHRPYDASTTYSSTTKKRKRGILSLHSCHPYFPTPKKLQKSCSPYNFQTPPHGSMPVVIPHSGITAAVHAAAYASYYHPQYAFTFNSSTLAHNTRFLEIE